MGGFYVGIALRLSLEDVKRVLREMFPATTVHESAEFRATFRGQYSGIVFDMYTNESDLPPSECATWSSTFNRSGDERWLARSTARSR